MPLRVLVVAADPRRRSALAEAVRSHDCDVLDLCSADVPAAVNHHPHVAVVDLVVNPRAGFAAAQALRFIPGGRHGVRPLAGLPILALSSDEVWRQRLQSRVPAVILTTDAAMPGEIWALEHRGS